MQLLHCNYPMTYTIRALCNHTLLYTLYAYTPIRLYTIHYTLHAVHTRHYTRVYDTLYATLYTMHYAVRVYIYIYICIYAYIYIHIYNPILQHFIVTMNNDTNGNTTTIHYKQLETPCLMPRARDCVILSTVYTPYTTHLHSTRYRVCYSMLRIASRKTLVCLNAWLQNMPAHSAGHNSAYIYKQVSLGTYLEAPKPRGSNNNNIASRKTDVFLSSAMYL